MDKAHALLRLVWAVAFLLGASECAKILFILPLPTKSHFTPSVVLGEELVRKGHDVTVFSPFPQKNPKFREITIDVKIFDEYLNSVNLTDFRGGFLKLRAPFTFWMALEGILETALSTKEFKELIQSNETFDLVLGEFSFAQECLAALGHKYGAPIIDISTTSPNILTLAQNGNPHSLSYIPDIQLTLTDRMDFFERLLNAVSGLTQLLGNYFYHLPRQEAMMRKYFTYPGAENLPPLRKMLENTSIVLVNSHSSISYPQPFAPNFIEIGGLHLKPSKKLPPELQKFMDEAKDGVVYISFGSIVRPRMLSSETVQAIVSAVKRLKKQRVIIKWDDPAPFQGLSNVHPVTWAPQQDILAHPNLRVFVTHGGYNSLIEVTHAGVPVIGIPVFADQPRNIKLYETRGVGKGLDLDTFTSDELYDAINTIINTPSFRENAQELGRRARDRPEKPLDKAVFWVEYVLRHKGAHHLKPQSVYLPYYQYLLLDVIAFVLLVVFIVYKLISVLIFNIFCSICGSKTRHSVTGRKKNN